MGGIYKSIFVATEDLAFGKLSAQTYTESFKASPNYYTGINAATMSKITGNYGEAKVIARQVVEMLENIEKDYWQEATLAEAYLLIKEVELATQHYIKARDLIGKNWGAIHSIHKQLWLLNHFTHVPKSVQEFFKPPVIVAFIGHMIDAPDRAEPRFKPEMENNVRMAIRSSIMSLDIQIGYTSLACGADILFVEEMLALDREVELFLPFNIDDFIQTSVAFAGDHWVERFEKILKEPITIHYLNKAPYSGDNYQFHLLAEAIAGAAKFRAKLMKTQPTLLAVISEFSLERKTGGVRDFMTFWLAKETIHRVNIDNYKTSIETLPVPSFKRHIGLRNIEPPILPISFVLTISSKHLFQLSTDHREYKSLMFKGNIGENQVFVFNRLAAILLFINEELFGSGTLTNKFQGSLNLGIIDNQRQKLTENDAILKGEKLCELSNENTVLVTEITAFMLAMNTDDLSIQYGGQANTDETELENVYRVSKN